MGAIRAPVAEPSVPEAVRGGLAQALAARGALGDGPALDSEVLEAADAPVAVDALGNRVHRVRLVVAVTRTGPTPRRVVLSAERSYVADGADPLVTAGRRAQAFGVAARQIGEQAATWALHAPRSESR